ncbi:phosphonate ABC transporter, permease protein PhnE [Halorubrum sp. BOL3-1]|nr:phosphonate ABC transporter, permease protein PhnE [Halorubrum sp. BOL3-1]
MSIARKGRWLGYALVAAVVTYLFLMALETVEWFRADLPSYLGTFAEALQDYFPFLVFGEGPVGVAFVPGGFSEYVTFIRQRNLLYDSGFFAGADSVFEYPILLFTQTGGPVQLFGAAGETLAIGFAGTIMAFPLALLFSILGSGRVTPFPFNFFFRGMMSAIRSIPALVWVLIYVPLGGISPTTATLAVATDTIGNLGRLFTDELEEIGDGPVEAMRTTGASKTQIIVFGMLAQVRNSFIAWTLYVFEINVRIAVGLGIIGAGGLGLVLSVQQGLFAYTNMMATIIVIFLLIVSVEMISQRTRAHLRAEDEPMAAVQLILGFPERLVRSFLK